MRLRTKLSIVLALLISTLAVNVALSVWSIRFLERELSDPLRSMQTVLYHFHEVKRLSVAQTDIVKTAITDIQAITTESPKNYPSLDIESTLTRLLALEEESNNLIDELERFPSVLLRSGISSVHNLRGRSDSIEDTFRTLQSSPTQEHFTTLIDSLDARHELIERVESRILEDAQLASNFGDNLKTRINTLLLVTLIGALAIGVLMVTFIRRWVFSPIEELRSGARRIATGDFSQPVKVYTHDELGELSDEFNRMSVLVLEMQDKKIEQERLAAMGEMAQRTVHNLRTPLSGIRALSETTLDELPDDSDLKDLQNRIIATVDRFEIWLKEMLRASTPLELQIETYCPKQLVQSVFNAHEPVAHSKKIDLKLHVQTHTPTTAQGDHYHLEHALTAVMSNAIDFAPESSCVDVTLAAAADNGAGYWTLRITNSGAMIPPDLHRTIFRPYFTTRSSGTGIGLAMCKRVVDQHSGQISVQSPLDPANKSGCAFILKFPVELAPKPTQQ